VNQGIAFAKTLRALESDDFRRSNFGLLIAFAVLLAWTWWALVARVPQYQSTNHVRIEAGRAIAYFPSTSDIAIGQPALVHFNGTAVRAQVQSIAPDYAVLVLASNPRPPIPPSSSPSADIEVARVSHASLALQILGRRPR
jgi:hypothetical protein